MKIHLATDHAGYLHKEAVKKYLTEQGIEVVDHGATTLNEGDDYPDFVMPCAQAVAIEAGSAGIIFGYSGQGEAMVANRVVGIRCAVFYGGSSEILTLSRAHNDTNMLSIGSHFVSADEAVQAITLWLQTAFSEEDRHVRRISKF